MSPNIDRYCSAPFFTYIIVYGYVLKFEGTMAVTILLRKRGCPRPDELLQREAICSSRPRWRKSSPFELAVSVKDC